MIHLYNTLSDKKEKFQSITPNKVLLYVCGITSYDLCHIGHLRVVVNFDLIVRYLRQSNYEVTYVRNITDIDDKIIKRAQEENTDFLSISRKYSDAMHEDFKAMQIIEPDFEPRATSYVKEMIGLIKNLEQAEMTYQTSKGDLCYRIRNFKDYGKLSNKKLDELRTGVRIEEDASKEDPLDFVLWKAAKENEPHWESPWGKGRPGWHIECSAMVRCCLGSGIDIHGGGRDLIFPHHENEIAQSEAAQNDDLANYWMHVGHLMINGKKMSKSLNNFITIRDLLEKYDAEVIKYFILSSHYRSKIDFSEAAMQQAQNSLASIYRAVADHPKPNMQDGMDGLEEHEQKFYAAMDDDFNTPLALAILFELVHIINKNQEPRALVSLYKCASTLGILSNDPQSFLRQGGASNNQMDEEAINKIEELISQRELARKEKNWDKSDLIREQLSKLGVALDDTPQGIKWHITKNVL
ncbi:MAG: cysteine--tRNA ligase [Candidatus Portiera sp.]|nr:cysteine--tRNA ligase [Portiera sp.]